MTPGQTPSQVRARALRALQDAVSTGGLVDPVAVARLVVDQVRDHFGADAAVIAVWDPDEAILQILAHNAPGTGGPIPPIAPGTGALDLAFRARQTVIVEDYRSWDRADPRAVARGVVSCVAVPLLVGREAIGALALQAWARRHFAPSEAELLSLMGAQVGIVLQLARLHRTSERQREEIARSAERQRALDEGIARAEKLRAIGQMAGGIAHDINQYLGLIAGHGDLALRSLDQIDPDVDRLRQSLEIIIQAATDGSATINRLLAFARPRGGAAARRVALGDLLGEVSKLTAPRWRDTTRAEGRPVTLDVSVEGDTSVDGFPDSLREAFTNLVLNAVDALPEGGAIRLVARGSGDVVTVDVTDTGVGIHERDRARIFEPFFTTKGEHGSGLGLAIVFSVVEQHRGHIGVESAVGKGATFQLTFPAAGAPVAPASPGQPAGQARTIRILAVDDEPALARMIGHMLRPDGHVVEEATSGEEALERLREAPFDLIIADVAMGDGMNGWQLAERVARRYPGTRLCLATGWGAQLDPERARSRGVFAIVGKPYRLADLQRLVALP